MTGHPTRGTPTRPHSQWFIFDAEGYRYTSHATHEDAVLVADRLSKHKKPYEIVEYVLRTNEDVRKLNMHDELVAACERARDDILIERDGGGGYTVDTLDQLNAALTHQEEVTT